MATGDVTLSIAIEGGSAKTVAIDSATRVLAKARDSISADADWQVLMVNKLASIVISQANHQQESAAAAGVSAKTYTPAS
jgi:hypothetical protein